MNSHHQRSVSLMKFLASVATDHGVSDHVYVVGGAVRNWVLGRPIKDIDVVLDAVASGRDSDWFARSVQAQIQSTTSLKTNQYGVAILTVSGHWTLDGHDMKGEVIEIVNARKESYGGESGKGYKPHMVEKATIEEDLFRREFTFNTLLWRLSDLIAGPNNAPILDLTGKGRQHLEDRVLHTPSDPASTFSDDPTRMLRAVKFVARYGFTIPDALADCIRQHASHLAHMPWDAVRKILVDDILKGPSPRESLRHMVSLGLADAIKAILRTEEGFASALGRALADMDLDPLLVLDIHDLQWPVRSSVSFLNTEDRARLRVILEGAPDFVKLLVKPPLRQQAIFDRLSVPLKRRGEVLQCARQALLDRPALVQSTIFEELLEEDVEARMTKRLTENP